jgi:tetratricopeptide (TPR) repeat protein
MQALVLILLAGQATPPAPIALPSVARDRAEAYYHFSLGLQARFSGDAQTSLDEYRKAARLDSGSAAIRVEMARLLREERKFDEAVVAAQEAVRLDRDNPDAHLILAQLYQMRAESAAGEEGLRKAAAEY